MTVKIQAEALVDFVRDIFLKAGCSNAEGERIGKYLVIANLTGHDSHGVQRVPRYLQWLREGHFRCRSEGEGGDRHAGARRRRWLARIWPDGGAASGQDRHREVQGNGARRQWRLRNAGHIGRVGDWAEMAAAEGLVSVHFVNAAGSSLVAPYGGVERRFSTAPYCVGVPRKGETPLVLDFATSVVAEGKVLNASFGGKKLPERRAGWPGWRRSAPIRICSMATTRRPARATTNRAKAPSARSATTRDRASLSCANCSAGR